MSYHGKLGSVNIELADTAYEVYRIEDPATYSILDINAVNRTPTPVRVSIAIVDSESNSYFLERDVIMEGYSTLLRTAQSMSAGDVLEVYCDTDNSVNVVAYGVQNGEGEIATP